VPLSGTQTSRERASGNAERHRVGDELAAADDDRVVGGVFYLAHQVAGDEHGPALTR
jgi:hypothetical protein